MQATFYFLLVTFSVGVNEFCIVLLDGEITREALDYMHVLENMGFISGYYFTGDYICAVFM